MNKKIIFSYALLSGASDTVVISEIPYLDWLEIRNSNDIRCVGSGGSVVECLSRDEGAAGSSLTGVTAL